ncbi:type I-E CRISPR-associated protein Cse2/CasB [Nocardia vulneris]|uniref:type I-E CRISPR-associated protein Cse2/CasB n=1 Tax=Nocardia vulneris TaxID=1141657 RepID=UPI0030D1CACC
MNTFADRDRALKTFVSERVSSLQRKYGADDRDAVAALARLRRGVGARAGSLPDLWALTCEDLPEELTDETCFSRAEHAGAATLWEQAAHDALTLYAWHQQGRTEPMHRRDAGFGAAMRVLGGQAGSVEAVRRRFHAMGTARRHTGRLIQLRGLIRQLRTQSIPLDYGRLACDLRCLDDGTYANQVLLQWGRDYHRRPAESTEQTSDEHTTTAKGQDQ